MKNNKKSFTLTEVIIVMILVGLLAAIAIPKMSGYVGRAKKGEAIATLKAIRAAQRIYRGEISTYVPVANTEWTTAGNLAPYIKPGDLSGTYFPESCYEVTTAANNTTFTATCVPAYSDNPSVTTLGNISIDQDGNISGY